MVLKFAGALYLGYIAWKLWTAGLLGQKIEAKRAGGLGASFMSGLLVTLGNPKTMLFYVALVPTLIPLAQIGPQDYAALVIVTAVVLLLVLVPYILLAAKARELLKEPSALKLLNRTAGGILAGTAVYIAARALNTDIRQTGRIWQKILFAPAPPIIRFWRGFPFVPILHSETFNLGDT